MEMATPDFSGTAIFSFSHVCYIDFVVIVVYIK